MSKKKRRKKEHCPNCGKGLEPWMDYCPKCGQENHIKRASLSLLFKDFLQDYWTFDSKLFRSIIPLLFKPGFLTKEFISGKRQKYIPPIRLYLFISFIFFLTSSLLNNKDNSNNQEKLVNITYSKEDKDSLTIDMMHNLTNENPILKAQYGNISRDSLQSLFEKDPNMKEALELMRKTEDTSLDKYMNKHFTKIFFLLIPVLAFIFLLLFYRKNFFYVDYLVFTLHIQSWFFIVLFASLFIEFIAPSKWVRLTSIIILFVYTLISAKKIFQVTYLGGILRLLGAGFIYVIALGFGAMLFFLIALLIV